MYENAFLVWGSSNDMESISCGGVMTATAKGRKGKAAFLDRGNRDTHQILDTDLTVFQKIAVL